MLITPPVPLNRHYPRTPDGGPTATWSDTPQLQGFVICMNNQASQVSPSLAASGPLIGVLEVAGVLDPLIKNKN